MFTSSWEERQLRREAEEFEKAHDESVDQAIEENAAANSSEDAARELFNEVRSKNPIYIQNVWLQAHPEFLNTKKNADILTTGLPKGKTLLTADFNDWEQAFAATAPKLQLENLDTLPEAELYDRLHQTQTQQAQQEENDWETHRPVFESDGVASTS